MNGDTLELAQMIQSMEGRLGDKISDLKSTVSGMNGAFTVEISGAKARIKDLEDENVREEWKTWIGRFSFGGVIFALHKGMTMLGWKI